MTERLRFTGEVMEPVNRADVETAVATLQAVGVETVAICLLHAYANPAHELEIRGIVKELWPDVYVSMSHEVAREIREYERVSSTAYDAWPSKNRWSVISAGSNAHSTTTWGSSTIR